MKIVQLEYFCMVSQYHSITQAAQKLYVTQPAISNAIKELEKEFSVNLFVRSKNHLTLTTEGELFYQKARELLASIKQTTQQFYDLGKQIPPIRIGIPPLLSTIFFRISSWNLTSCTRRSRWSFLNTDPSVPLPWYRMKLWIWLWSICIFTTSTR